MVPIGGIGIRNVKRTVELTLGVPAVDDVIPLGRAMVPLLSLGPNGFAAQCDLVRFKDVPGMHQFHRARLFVDDYAVGFLLSVELSGDPE
jgi:hypothetical protein